MNNTHKGVHVGIDTADTSFFSGGSDPRLHTSENRGELSSAGMNDLACSSARSFSAAIANRQKREGPVLDFSDTGQRRAITAPRRAQRDR